jgi:hypothetical protein
MRGKAYAHRRAPNVEFRQAPPRGSVWSSVTTAPEVIMNRTRHPFSRLAALATTALGLLLLTAGQATAQRPVPGPGGTGSAPAPVQPSIDASVSVLQWTLFAVALLAALVIGAALMNLAQRHRITLPFIGGNAARSSA